MSKLLNALIAAVILLVLTMSAADFLTTGNFDPLATSAACCAPLICGAICRRMGSSVSRAARKKKSR